MIGWKAWALGAALALMGFGSTAQAQSLRDAPAGRVILSVSGDFQAGNGRDGYGTVEFDRERLAGLGVKRVRMTLPGGRGPAELEGVMLSDLVAALGARASQVTAITINDYAVSIPLAELARRPVMLVYAKDGRPLSAGSHGPLWIVWPEPSADGRTPQRWLSEMRSLTFS